MDSLEVLFWKWLCFKSGSSALLFFCVVFFFGLVIVFIAGYGFGFESTQALSC